MMAPGLHRLRGLQVPLALGSASVIDRRGRTARSAQWANPLLGKLEESKMAATNTELEAMLLVHRAFLIALAWKDTTKGGLHQAFLNQFQPLIQGLNKATPLDTTLIAAVNAEHQRITGQLPRP